MIADAGYESKGLKQDLRDRNGWRLVIVKRREQAFRIAGLNWIVERSFGWLGRQRRMSKDEEYRASAFGASITVAGCFFSIFRIEPW